ncbi:MAG TPA: Ig-like domain-containing protein [Saprospiraceae bacterium]|nr:Ig-like domain-containing protein [Saprospiraceae bacterium]
MAQTAPSPYKLLATSASLPVADTVSGVNLSVYKTNPLPKHGKLTITQISSGGSGIPHVYRIAYAPNAGFSGIDTFTVEFNYVATWPYLSYQGYRVAVRPTSLLTRADFAIADNGNTIQIPVLDNDQSDAGPLTLTEIPLCVHGTASIVGGTQVLFTPEPGYTGTAHFNYVVCDAQNHCLTGHASVGVNAGPPPAQELLQVATTKNTALSIPLTYSGYGVQQPPANGQVTLSNGRAFHYVPNPNFAGEDQFVLAKSVNGSIALKTVKVVVVNTAGPNRMAMDDVVYTPQGQAVTFNVRNNDVGKLTVKSWSPPPPQAGTLSGTNSAGQVTFTPHPAFSGAAYFSYKIGNNFVSDLEVANVQVLVGNLPPAQASYHMNTAKGSPFVLNHAIPFSAFQFTLTAPPAHGSCVVYPGHSTQTLQGQTVSGNNLVVYTPEAGFVGEDEFTLDYCLNANGQCQSVTVQMEVLDMPGGQGAACIADCVWAGDANGDGTVNHRDLLPLGYAMGMEGPARSQQPNAWLGQSATDWANAFAPLRGDLKQVDSDGDGMITLQDTAAIHQHYGRTHQFSPRVALPSKGMPFKLRLLTSPNPGVGDLVQMEVSLGTASKPVPYVNGFSYDLTLSPEIQDSALQMIYYDNSWLNLNSPSLWLSKSPAPHRLETAFTRTNGLSGTGFGPVGRVEFIITDILDVGKPGRKGSMQVIAEGLEALSEQGLLTGERTQLDIPLRLADAGPAHVQESDLLLYPTPAQEHLTLHLNGTDAMTAIEVLDAAGRCVYRCDAPQPEHQVLDLSTLPAGCYAVRVQTTTGLVVKRVQLAR